MNLEDLQTLEIGLELYLRESPLNGECDPIIVFLLRVVRRDISRMKPGGRPTGAPQGGKGNPFTLHTTE